MAKVLTPAGPAPAAAQPNLVDRLFLRLEHTQTPLTIQLGVDLAGPLDGDVLVEALAGTLADYPLLQTLARPTAWGYHRELAGPVDPAALLTAVASDDAWPAVIRRPMAPETDLPVRLALGSLEGRDRLLVTLHHSVVDAVGGVQWLDRLAWRYGQCLSGQRPAPLGTWQSRRYRDLLWRQPAAARWRLLARSGDAFGELLHNLRGVRCATFQDLPIPSRGDVSSLTIDLDATDQAAIADRRRQSGGTVNDVLLAAMLTACRQVWPDTGPAPIVVHLPVNLREPGEVLIGNRVADVRLVFDPIDCRTMDGALAAVRQATPRATTHTHALARLLERGLAGYVPPAVFRRVVNGHMARPENPVLSLSFSNLGDLRAMPGDFGPVPVLGLDVLGPLSVPPGISAWVATCRGQTRLTIGYIEPVVRPTSAAAVARHLREVLRR